MPEKESLACMTSTEREVEKEYEHQPDARIVCLECQNKIATSREQCDISSWRVVEV